MLDNNASKAVYRTTYFFIDTSNDNTLYFYNQNRMWIETNFKLKKSQITITQPGELISTASINGGKDVFSIDLHNIKFFSLEKDVPDGVLLIKKQVQALGYSSHDHPNSGQSPIDYDYKKSYPPSDLSSEFKEFKEFKKKAPIESEENKTSEEIELKDFPRLESERTKTYYDDLEL